MSARLLPARYVKVDGIAIEDYEEIPDGPIESLAELHGTAGCVLQAATYVQR